MKRVLYVIISIFVSGLFWGGSFSIAGDMDELANALDLGVASAAPGAIADKNYIKDVWVSNSNSSTSSAGRVFSSGSTVYLHCSFYLSADGSPLRYYMVGNAAGSLVEFKAFSTSRSAGDNNMYLSLSSMDPGVYFFTSAIIIAGNNAMSPTPYWFVIE